MNALLWILIASSFAADPVAPPASELPSGVVAQLGTHRFRANGQLLLVRLSPDGRRLATMGVMNQLRLWDVESGKLLKCIDLRRSSSRFAMPFAGCTWSAAGKLLAVIESQTVVRLLDGHTLEERLTIRDPAFDPAQAVRFEAADRTLVVGNEESASAFDVVTGKLLRTARYAGHQSPAMHPYFVDPEHPGRAVAVTKVYNNGSTIYVRDGDPGTRISSRSSIYGLAASADAKRIFSGDSEGYVTWWDRDSKDRVLVWPGLTAQADFLAASADGTIVAAGSRAANVSSHQAGNRVRIWRIIRREPSENDGPDFEAEELWPDDSHNALILSLSYIDGGRHLVSTSTDGEVGVWSVEQRRRLARLSRGSASSVSTSKNLLAAHGTNDSSSAVRLYDLSRPAEPRQLHVFAGTSRAALSHDGSRAAAMKSGKDAASVMIWDTATHELIREIECGTRGAYRLLLSHDGRRLAIGGTESGVQIWNVDTGEQTLHSKTVSSHALCFTPDGRSLITKRSTLIRNKSSILVWSVESGALEYEFGSGEPVLSFAPFDDNRRLLAGGNDGVIRVWDIPTGKLLKELPPQTSAIFSLAISPDGTQFASGAGDGTIYLWNAAIVPPLNRP